MGKAADNERLRLRAMFFNTLAAACVITGLFVPYFVLLTAWGRMGSYVRISRYRRLGCAYTV